MKTQLLTMRQRKALVLFAFKFSYQQIGDMLGASKDTIKNDILKAYKILGTNCLAAALMKCLILGEITVEDIKCIYYTLPQS